MSPAELRARLLSLLDQADATTRDLMAQAPDDEAGGRVAKAHAHLLWAIESLMEPSHTAVDREPDPGERGG